MDAHATPASSQRLADRRLAVCGVVVLAAVLRGDAQAVRFDVGGALELYATGRFEAALDRVPAADASDLRRWIATEASRWADTDGPDAPRRHAVVAAFVLELAHARVETEWHEWRSLVEWACERLRRGPATEFERVWDAASIAVAGRTRQQDWLMGLRTRIPVSRYVGAPRPMAGPLHLEHARARFPEDAGFRLAHAVAWNWGRDAEPDRNGGRARPSPSESLQVLKALEPLTRDPSVGAEAWLRAGLALLAGSRPLDALQAFEAATVGDDLVRYLAHFSSGRALQALERDDDAAEAYRRALDARPGAESATLALARLELGGPRHRDALARIEQQFSTAGRASDPARLLGYGTYYRWPALRTAMRAAIPR